MTIRRTRLCGLLTCCLSIPLWTSFTHAADSSVAWWKRTIVERRENHVGRKMVGLLVQTAETLGRPKDGRPYKPPGRQATTGKQLSRTIRNIAVRDRAVFAQLGEALVNLSSTEQHGQTTLRERLAWAAGRGGYVRTQLMVAGIDEKGESIEAPLARAYSRLLELYEWFEGAEPEPNRRQGDGRR